MSRSSHSAVNEGVDALVQGRADVTTHAIGSAKVREADARGNSLHTPGLLASRPGAHQESCAGLLSSTVKAGSSSGIVEDTCAYTYEFTLSATRLYPTS